MKYLIIMMVLVGCGNAQQDYLLTQPCSPVGDRGISGGWKDITSGSSYTIFTSCMVQSNAPINGCQTQGAISANRDGGPATFNINQSKPMAGCLPVGNYRCILKPDYAQNTMIVDCSANGVFNWRRP